MASDKETPAENKFISSTLKVNLHKNTPPILMPQGRDFDLSVKKQDAESLNESLSYSNYYS